MSEEKHNVANFNIRGSASNTSLPSSSFPSVSPFCHSCQTNQTLILSILANGDITDMSEEAIHTWKSSLASRYPPVCDSCQGMVEERIRRADKMARRLIWGDWLKKSRAREVSSSVENSGSSTNRIVSGIQGKDMVSTSSLSKVVWLAQCFCFATSTIVWSTFAWRQSDLTPLENSHCIAALVIAHLSIWQWDPTLPRRNRIKRRLSPSSVVKVKGREKFETAQHCIFLIRAIHLLIPLSRLPTVLGFSQTQLRYVISFLSIASQLVLTIVGFLNLRVEQPQSISLKSTPVSPREASTARAGAVEESELSLLSLDSGSIRTSHYQERVDKEHAITEVDDMDWSPTLTGNDSASFELGPQRYFQPVQRTGLEELMESHLALDDGKDAIRRKVSEGKATTTQRKLIMWLVSTILVLICAIVAVALHQTQLRTALSPMLDSRLQDRQIQWQRQIARLQELANAFKGKETPKIDTR
ncbi:hypothetical protein CBS101457_000351 [Exobasidium rhododendri]|nr:hypothetical protein CBS101457_000351 [Exobasidium rhododendri]